MRLFRFVLIGLILLVAASITLEMSAEWAYETSGAFNGDSPIYWAVGRGMTNGLRLYTDLFDIKPPGMFSLSALSFAWTGDMRLGHVSQALVVVLLPLLLLIPWIRLRKAGGGNAALPSLLMLLSLGGTFAAYVSLRGAEFQTESFGIFFTTLFLGLAYVSRGKNGWWWPVILGVPFFFSIFFKEPFALACVLSGLAISRSKRDVLRLVIFPAIIAGVFFLLSLLLLGAFRGYLGYLDFMVNARTQRFGSPWNRAVLFEMLYYDFSFFTPFAAWFFVLLCLWFLLRGAGFELGNKRLWPWILLLLTGLGVAGYGLQTLRVIFTPGVPFRWYPKTDTTILFAGIAVSIYAWYEFMKRRGGLQPHIDLLLAIGCVLGSGYMVGLSGEFVGHHYLFPLTVYMAMTIALAEHAFTHPTKGNMIAFWCMTMLLTAAVLLPHLALNEPKRSAGWKAEAEQERIRAGVIDRVLDACDEERYLIVGEAGTNVFGFTRHSPLGPVFFQHTLVTEYPAFTKAFVGQLLEAEVILTRATGGRPNMPGVDDYLERNFSAAAPPCAGEIQGLGGGLSLLFRTGESDVQLNLTDEGPVLVMLETDR